MTLTVGLDATSAARQEAGIGRYTRELLRALAARQDEIRYRVYYCAGGLTDHRLPPLNGRFSVRALPLSDRIVNAMVHRARLPIPVQALTGRIDLFHSPDFTLPVTLGAPSLLTVFDLAFLRRPECAYPTLRAYLEAVVPRSVRRATHVIAISQNTRRDLLELLGTPPEKVTAIPLAPGESFGRLEPERAQSTVRGLGVDEPYILSVGTLEPRKNYVRLLEVYALLRQRGETRRLVVAGGRGWMYEPVFQRLDELRLQEYVSFVNPPDVALAALYAAADVFVYPSLYEGFGIPPLEAFACGTVVACSDSSSLPEVVGDAALTFDPTDIEEMAEVIGRLLADRELGEELRRRGADRVRQFSWARNAADTVRLYEMVGHAS